MSSISSQHYDFMHLVSQEEYKILEDCMDKNSPNSVKESVTGGIKESQVNNIEVSQGGTILIQTPDIANRKANIPVETSFSDLPSFSQGERKNVHQQKNHVVHSSNSHVKKKVLREKMLREKMQRRGRKSRREEDDPFEVSLGSSSSPYYSKSKLKKNQDLSKEKKDKDFVKDRLKQLEGKRDKNEVKSEETPMDVDEEKTSPNIILKRNLSSEAMEIDDNTPNNKIPKILADEASSNSSSSKKKKNGIRKHVTLAKKEEEKSRPDNVSPTSTIEIRETSPISTPVAFKRSKRKRDSQSPDSDYEKIPKFSDDEFYDDNFRRGQKRSRIPSPVLLRKSYIKKPKLWLSDIDTATRDENKSVAKGEKRKADDSVVDKRLRLDLKRKQSHSFPSPKKHALDLEESWLTLPRSRKRTHKKNSDSDSDEENTKKRRDNVYEQDSELWIPPTHRSLRKRNKRYPYEDEDEDVQYFFPEKMQKVEDESNDDYEMW